MLPKLFYYNHWDSETDIRIILLPNVLDRDLVKNMVLPWLFPTSQPVLIFFLKIQEELVTDVK